MTRNSMNANRTDGGNGTSGPSRPAGQAPSNDGYAPPPRLPDVEPIQIIDLDAEPHRLDIKPQTWGAPGTVPGR